MLEMYHPDARNFFVLFKHIDIDGSRRISFSELERLIREELHIKVGATHFAAARALACPRRERQWICRPGRTRPLHENRPS